MHRAPLSLRVLALTGLCLSGAIPEADHVSDDLGRLTEEQLLDRVRDRKNTVDRKIFEELGRRRSKASYEALVDATDLVTGQWPLRYAYQAFARFKDSEDLEDLAIDFLFDESGASNTRKSSAAVHALALFGEPVHPRLRKVLKSSKSPLTRSAALAPLLPEMAVGGEKRDFRTVYENLVLTYGVHRPLGVETFKTFAETGGVRLFSKRLSDKKLSVEVRGMMITALEETTGDPALEMLLEGLNAREPRLLYETLRSLARRGTDLHLGELKKLSRHKDDFVRHEALVSEARIQGGDPAFLEKALSLAEHKKSIERGAAAISLGEIRTPGAMVALHALLDDPEYSVRAEALLAVAAARRPSSIPVLIKRLDKLSGTERVRTATELRLLTGEDHGAATGRWSKWWADSEDGFEMPAPEDARQADSERDERRASNSTQSRFYGLDVSSERVCFVVDLSGSMNFRAKSGKTRLEILKSELDRFLEAYPSGRLFNLIFFGNDAEKWRSELTLMNDKARSEARAHVRSLDAPGATAIYNGLKAAFEDQRVDTIYLLTDGGPSGGELDDIDEIIAEVRRWNSLRHLVIHSVAVGRKSPLLQTLAADSNGRYVVVD